jgi:hypothetical protein
MGKKEAGNTKVAISGGVQNNLTIWGFQLF